MIFSPNIPQGGFFAAITTYSAPDLIRRLESKGFDTVSFAEDGVIFSAIKEFSGQGLWHDDTNAVAYDLDLINIEELKKSIAIDPKSSIDTGMLIWELYRKLGTDFIDRLRGAFGFSIWDGERKTLIVVTDPYGIRPVVFTQNSEEMMAASRIRHLLINSGISKEIDPEAIYHYLFFQAICSPVTIYKSIRKLEPGKGLRYRKNELSQFTHYDIQYRPENQYDESHWIREIPIQVERAVKRHVDASDPEKTGCFLSGGTDSSSVAGYYTKLNGTPAKTFSIGFDDPKYNELDYARIAARHFGLDQHEYLVKPDDVLFLIERIPEIYEEPFGNASVVPAFYCAKAAREVGLDILFGGDGGDEIFGGNERYVTNLIFEKYFLLPPLFRKKIFEPAIKLLPDFGLFHKAKSYINRSNMENPNRFFSYNLLAEKGAKSFFNDDFLSNFNPDCFLDLARNHYNHASPAHDTDRLLYIDMKFTITDNDLRKVTQMVESSGTKVQFPLLDRDLVDFTATIPPTLKIKWKKNRYIFKKAMKGFLPDEIIHKSKHGMGMPISSWFRTDPKLSELLQDHLFSPNPQISQFMKPEFLKDLEQSFRSDTTSYYGDNLWVFLILELWLQNHT